MLAGAITFVILVVSLALVHFTSIVLCSKRCWVLFCVVPAAHTSIGMSEQHILPSYLASLDEPGFPEETGKKVKELVGATQE